MVSCGRCGVAWPSHENNYSFKHYFEGLFKTTLVQYAPLDLVNRWTMVNRAKSTFFSFSLFPTHSEYKRSAFAMRSAWHLSTYMHLHTCIYIRKLFVEICRRYRNHTSPPKHNLPTFQGANTDHLEGSLKHQVPGSKHSPKMGRQHFLSVSPRRKTWICPRKSRIFFKPP